MAVDLPPSWASPSAQGAQGHVATACMTQDPAFLGCPHCSVLSVPAADVWHTPLMRCHTSLRGPGGWMVNWPSFALEEKQFVLAE